MLENYLASRKPSTLANYIASHSRRTDKRYFGMKALIDRVDWAHCRQCNNNNWDDCVEYAMKAAECGVIGCEYLVISDDKDGSDSRDGTVSPS